MTMTFHISEPFAERTAISLNELAEAVHASCRNAGWYLDPQTREPIERNVGEMLALVHSEISEALEAYRKDLMDDHLPHRQGVEVELADAIIRIMDLSGYLGINVGNAVVEKWRYNQTRHDHTLAARAEAGGKKI